MARNQPKPLATQERTLPPVLSRCWDCGQSLWISYHNHRRLLTLQGLLEIRIPIRRCRNRACTAYKQPLHPPEEGALALPGAECGLDLVAFVGACRYQQHRSVPEIHALLQQRGVSVCERTVTNLIARYEELLTVQITDPTRLKARLQPQGRAILAVDGLQPDVGHEVLWIMREVLTGEVLLAKSLLSSSTQDLAAMLQTVKDALPVPVSGVVSDGQIPIRTAVAQVFSEVPHQLCQFHYLREAAKPISEADRHAKKKLKKQVRGVRPLERSLEGRDDPEAQAALAYCQAVRSALTDDGRPPLIASGLKLRRRLQVIATSIAQVEAKGGPSPRSDGSANASKWD